MAELQVLDVRLYGQTIGTLTRLPGDRILFAFDDAYIADAARPTFGLSFKDAYGALLTEFKPTQTRLPPFFANLLPEGAMRGYLAAKAGVNPAREFFLMWVLGRDLPGALEIVAADGEPSLPDEAHPSSDGAHGTAEDAILRFSLAGVQLKFSAIKDAKGGLTIPANGMGGSWIVKLPSTMFEGVPENEFAMMELARRVGIDVPQTELVPLEAIKGLPRAMERLDSQAFAIRRFDRAANGGKIHIEDFAQVFGVYPDDKYKNASYRSIAEVLWIETGEAGIVEFIRRFVFNALIGNGDMHLKNWSLIYPDRRNAQLAPAYDFVSTIGYMPNETLALNFQGSKRFDDLTYDRFAGFAAKAGLPEHITLQTARQTVADFRAAWQGSGDLAIRPVVRNAIDELLPAIPIWTA
ncbi:MAG TPA: type II toxin-antitoxin system HipA family toxin [Rhizomicrobium sp.]|jgi:serine/threonine-protein kinase HipA|nr:type II toxin-antitoxin system HipA family toxin [Rhizomicrobium sp.]